MQANKPTFRDADLDQYQKNILVLLNKIARAPNGMSLASALQEKLAFIGDAASADAFAKGITGYASFSKAKAMLLLELIARDVNLMLKHKLTKFVIGKSFEYWTQGAAACPVKLEAFVSATAAELRELGVTGKTADRIVRLIVNYNI